jgi:hypothetical protein
METVFIKEKKKKKEKEKTVFIIEIDNDQNIEIFINQDKKISDIVYSDKKIHTIWIQNFGKFCCQKCNNKIYGKIKFNENGQKIVHERDSICRFKINDYPSTKPKPIVISYSFDYIKNSYQKDTDFENKSNSLITGSFGDSNSNYTYIYANPRKAGFNSYKLEHLNEQIKYNLKKIIQSKPNDESFNFNKVCIIDFSNVTLCFSNHHDNLNCTQFNKEHYIKEYFKSMFSSFDSKTLVILCCSKRFSSRFSSSFQNYESYVEYKEECPEDTSKWCDAFYEQFECRIVIIKEEVTPNLKNYFYYESSINGVPEVKQLGNKEINVDEVIYHAIKIAYDSQNIDNIEVHTNDGNTDNGPFGSGKRKVLDIDKAEDIAKKINVAGLNRNNIEKVINNVKKKSSLRIGNINTFHEKLKKIEKVKDSNFIDLNFTSNESKNIANAIRESKSKITVCNYSSQHLSISPNSIYNTELKEIQRIFEFPKFSCLLLYNKKKPNKRPNISSHLAALERIERYYRSESVTN